MAGVFSSESITPGSAAATIAVHMKGFDQAFALSEFLREIQGRHELVTFVWRYLSSVAAILYFGDPVNCQT